MHSRLLPLNPAPLLPAQSMRRFARPRLTLPSLPWLEFALFAAMIYGLVALGA